FRALRGAEESLTAQLLRGEQSNSSLVYGQRLVLKLFRKLVEGVNPDLEVGRFLTERTRFTQIPRVAGFLEYKVARHEPVTVGILQAWVESEGDAWRWTLDHLKRLYSDVLVTGQEAPPIDGSLLELAAGAPPPDELQLVFGIHLEMIRVLAQRTGELHLALASDTEAPEFAPERMSTLYQRSVYQSMRNLSARVLESLRVTRPQLSGETGELSDRLLATEAHLLERFRVLLGTRIDSVRIRCHGDYHLGQVLFTGNDFVILDFEGEPARSLGERRLKRSPLRDVAGMLRSFDYAAQGSLIDLTREGSIRAEDAPRLEPWARVWRQWMGSIFLRSYLRTVEGSELVPRNPGQLAGLLDVLMLEKAVYELGYELNNRPDWAIIPLRSILELLRAEPTGEAR
ncbi:MAG: alpha-amylase, partial [Myxococcales bacterium]